MVAEKRLHIKLDCRAQAWKNAEKQHILGKQGIAGIPHTTAWR